MSNNPNQQQQVAVQVRHEKMAALYANQVLINTTAEEVFLEFSPGVIMAAGSAVLPIHTRIAMTPVGLARLHQAIGKALQNYQFVQNPPPPATPENLPPLDIKDIPILAGGKNPE